MRLLLVTAWLLFVSCAIEGAQAPLPTGWPSVLQFGIADAPGGAPVLAQAVPGGFRYTYFSGGVNTGAGWSTWNSPPGDYATLYFQESITNGLVPVGIYYQLLQSTPHSGSGESAEDLSNFGNLLTMKAWFADFTLLLQKAGAFTGKTVVLNVEPDLWGYFEQAATAAGGVANVPGQVGACGGDVVGYANNVAGFAQAIIHLRNLYAPNVLIGFNASIWGTGWDLLTSVPKPDDAKAMAMGQQSAAYFASLGAQLDLLFGETLDADSAYDQIIRGDALDWFQSDDYRHLGEFDANLSANANLRIVLWQTPIGNTLMQSCNNSSGHYQSNQVEWLLDNLANDQLADFANDGVIAVLFGGGQPSDTQPSDADGDGVTDPGPIAANPSSSNQNPNTIQAVLGAAGSAPVFAAAAATLTTPNAADDDGGYLRWKLYEYYQAGPLVLSAGAAGASQLAFVVQPSTTVAGSTIAPAVQVAIQDTTGTTVTATAGNITLALASGSGSLLGTLTVPTIQGVATFSSLSLTTPGTGYTLSATAGILTSATRAPFSVTTPPLPSITSFAPTSGGIGASVVIQGANFVGVTAVQFAGSAASFSSSSTTQCTATIPVGATSGTISITALGGTGTSSTSFTVIPAPVITSISPTSGGSGTQVQIDGSNFAGTTLVSFNGTAASFTVNGAGTQITTTVPGGATNGPITVTTPGGSASSGIYRTGISPNPTASSSGKGCGSGWVSAIGILGLLGAVRRRHSTLPTRRAHCDDRSTLWR